MTESLETRIARVFPITFPRRLSARLIAGLLQGLLLYLLLTAADKSQWPAIQPLLFSPLLLVVLLLPPVLIVGVGNMAPRRLILWAVLLMVIVAVLGLYDVWRAVDSSTTETLMGPGRTGVTKPTGQVMLFAAVFTFVGFALIVAGEATRRCFAPYTAYFEASWKLALQIILSLAFIGVFQLVLWTGAGLFQLLGLGFFQTLLGKSWFYIPANALAFAAGLHLTDVRPELIRGIRTLLLTLASWLLPLLVLIVAGFLLSIPMTGLAPLWATRSAAGLLLGVAALTVLFINAAFKSGETVDAVPRLLRISSRVACVMTVPLIALAGYGIALRIGQYGLTISRTLAVACLLLATCYAIGYTWAALDRHGWLRRVAPTNVFTAILALLIIVALCTPVADPARLAVASQVGRLLSGRIATDAFDFDFLRFDSAVYGRAALARLQTETAAPDAAAIRKRSEQASALTSRESAAMPPLSAADLARNITLRSAGKIPSSFFSNDWHPVVDRRGIPSCMRRVGYPCDAYLLDLDHSGQPAVVLTPAREAAGDLGYGTASLYQEDTGGTWRFVATLEIGSDCSAARNALARGNYRVVPPLRPDIMIGNRRIHLQPELPDSSSYCEK